MIISYPSKVDSFRVNSILSEQNVRGSLACHVTGIRQKEWLGNDEVAGEFRFRRTLIAKFQMITMLRYVGMVHAMKLQLGAEFNGGSLAIIHAHSELLNGLPVCRARRGVGLPTVYEVRVIWRDVGVDHGAYRKGSILFQAIHTSATWVSKRASAITPICGGLRSDFADSSLLGDKVTVDPNAVNKSKLKLGMPIDEIFARKIKQLGSPEIGIFGSLYNYEGLDMLKDAVSAFLAKFPLGKLVSVGSADREVELKRNVKALGLCKSVVFVGRIPHDKELSWYSLFAIVEYPCRSVLTTEYVKLSKLHVVMAVGKALVLSYFGSRSEKAGDVFIESAFAAGNLADLEKKLIERLKSLSDQQYTVESGRRYVIKHRNWSESVARFTSGYKNLVGRSIEQLGINP